MTLTAYTCTCSVIYNLAYSMLKYCMYTLVHLHVFGLLIPSVSVGVGVGIGLSVPIVIIAVTMAMLFYWLYSHHKKSVYGM